MTKCKCKCTCRCHWEYLFLWISIRCVCCNLHQFKVWEHSYEWIWMELCDLSLFHPLLLHPEVLRNFYGGHRPKPKESVCWWVKGRNCILTNEKSCPSRALYQRSSSCPLRSRGVWLLSWHPYLMVLDSLLMLIHHWCQKYSHSLLR